MHTLADQLEQRQHEVIEKAEAKLDNDEPAMGVEGAYADYLENLSRQLTSNDAESPATIFKSFVADARDEIDRSLQTAAASKVALDRLQRDFGDLSEGAISDAESRRRAFSEIIDKETKERGPRSADGKRSLIERNSVYDEADFRQIRRRLADGYSDEERLELLAHVTAECVESNR